jgi:hypothetical protein
MSAFAFIILLQRDPETAHRIGGVLLVVFFTLALIALLSPRSKP